MQQQSQQMGLSAGFLLFVMGMLHGLLASHASIFLVMRLRIFLGA